MTTFFVAIPLDATTHKEFTPNFGLQFQGSRAYQSVKVEPDLQVPRLEAVELKYVVAGALAVGAAVAVSHKNSNTQQSFQQQQQQKEACPTQTC